MHGTQCDKGCPKQGGRLSPHFGKECSPNCMKFLVPPWQQPEDHSRSLGEGRALQTTLYLPRTCREQWCWAVGLDFAYKHKWDTPFIGTPRNTTGCGHASLGEALSWQSLPINVDGPLWQIIVNSGPNQQSKALLPTMLFQPWGDLRQCSGQCDQNRTLVVVLKKKKKNFFFSVIQTLPFLLSSSWRNVDMIPEAAAAAAAIFKPLQPLISALLVLWGKQPHVLKWLYRVFCHLHC